MNVFRELRKAQQSWERCKDSARLAQSALTIAYDAQKREALRPILEEMEIALARAYRKFSQLQLRLKGLQEAIRRREASFAQSQLLDFIRSDRYSSTPLHFANVLSYLSIDNTQRLVYAQSCSPQRPR